MSEPTPINKMLEEIVDAVNSMTAEESRAAEYRAGYGGPSDYRSFWD